MPARRASRAQLAHPGACLAGTCSQTVTLSGSTRPGLGHLAEAAPPEAAAWDRCAPVRTWEDTMSDELIDPATSPSRASSRRPWRPFSLLLVALLGGSLAV